MVDLGAFFFFTQKIHPGFIDPVPIPLWQLVYHDSVLGYTGEGLCGYSGGDYLAMTALYGLLPTQLDDTGRRFSFELRSAYCAEMLSHEFLPVANDGGGKAFAARTVAWRAGFGSSLVPYRESGKNILTGRNFV